MGKERRAWYCSECGHKESKWSGQCLSCGAWNTFHQEVELAPANMRFEREQASPSKPLRLKEITLSPKERHLTSIGEFDRLVGGGLVRGSLSLIAGDPGIGKSTLVLQVAGHLAQSGLKVLYICGEESVEQTFARAKRLAIDADSLFFLSETHFSLIKSAIDALSPDLVIVDSIQIVYKGEISAAPGSVTQVRETASEFMHLAKGRHITTLLVGHVTKAGEIAGPRVLEHLVDTVLYFEGDRHQNFRLLRVIKNRFGPTDEIGVFQMQAGGLIEVPNPSEIFLEERQADRIGSAIIASVEGSRPILVEVQALVTPSPFPSPSRRGSGIDPNRLALLLAVLEKHLAYRLYSCDVFVSLAGGLRIIEPSTDLGVILAIASSSCNTSLLERSIAIGEIGLGGEVRSVTKIESRIKEAARMGFSRCILPKHNLKGVPNELRSQIQLIGVERIEEAIEVAMSVQ